MAKSINIATTKEFHAMWQSFMDSYRNSTPVDTSETPAARIKRIKRLEKNPEEWFAYYFPNFCTSAPAAFHKRATKRFLSKAEWFEVRSWCRGLAKSARSMMEIIYLAMTGKVHNVLLVSNSSDNAIRLLLPFKTCFEGNLRIENDYGRQVKQGNWRSDEFFIKRGCSFRALGWGESPRGTRKDNYRPDCILIDDIDTDEECRNEDIMTNKVNWIEQALIGTRDVSTPTRILACGNIIHINCAVAKLAEKADKHDIVNIRDEQGKSTWIEKNSEEAIDRVLDTISYESAQKEYYNNPMDGSDTFRDLKDGKIPRLRDCNVCIYADPATSNKDVTSGSYKAVGVLTQKGFDYYIVRVFLDTMSTAKFVQALFDCYNFCITAGVEFPRVYIENNSLQNPFYEQVILPAIYQIANETNVFLPIIGDDRDKKDKYTRIEGTLEPINRLGHMIFNDREEDNPHMKRLKAQFKNFSRKQKRMDGPDMVEGGVFKLKEQEAVTATGGVETFKRINRKRF